MNRLFKLTVTEYRLIRLPLLLFIAAAVAGLVMIGIAWWARTAATARQQQAHGRLEQLQVEAAQMLQNRQDYDHFSGRFRDLKAKGIIGDEDRLQWVEVLAGLRRNNPEMQIRFRIEPQRPLDFIPDIPEGMKVFGSRMWLEMQAPHETRLLKLLAELDREAHGLHLLRQCSIRRGRLTPGRTGWVADPLEAACVIEWISVRQVSAPVVEGGAQ